MAYTVFTVTRLRCGGVLALAALMCAAVVSAELSSSSSSSKDLSKDSSKDLLTTNHQLLSGLGMARLPAKAPLVAATDDDSRVFVVRLPPSQHYYSLLKPPPSHTNSVSKVEVGFRSNGKPARVYHWNIPVLKKMAAARRRSTQGNNGALSLSQKASKKPSKSKLAANRRKAAAYHRLQQQQQQQQQQHLQLQQQQQQHHLKQKQHQKVVDTEPAGPSPYFYVPANPAKKTSMHKLLGGNGKPHSMYVLEKSKTPAYYQRLLP